MSTAITRTAAVVLAAALFLAACNAADGIQPPENPSPTPARTDAPEPDPQTLDVDTAAELYVDWREAVYGLPPTQPEAVDVDAAADAIVVPGSDAADWVTQELELARDRGVIVRGGIHAEPISAVEVTGDRATVTICSSADVRVTDVATGDAVADEAVDTSYTRFDVAFRRIDDAWLVERADSSDERDCVPPSIEEAVTAAWAAYAEAWLDLERRGGGPEIGALAEVVTDRFASSLRGFPPHDPVADPPPFTDFEVTAGDRTTVTGHACRSNQLQNVEWVLVDGQWRIDFVGQVGQEPMRCP